MTDRTQNWQAQATQLQSNIHDAEKKVGDLDPSLSAIGSPKYIAAQLAHLNAVTAYNNFIASDQE